MSKNYSKLDLVPLDPGMVRNFVITNENNWIRVALTSNFLQFPNS